MKKFICCVWFVCFILFSPVICQGEIISNAYVATVHGSSEFQISNGGTQIYFNPQPDTAYVWNENNGSAPGTIATYNGAVRDGMKTFACTDIAYGKRLDTIKMEFDFYSGIDTATGSPTAMINPGINFFLTDGLGNYGMWSPGSGGTPYSTTDISGEPGWKHLTLDCTNLAENTWGQMNEYNGGLSTDRPLWSVIRGWTIAGFYDFQRTPQGGFEDWDDMLWSDITNIGVPDTTLNQFGIVLFHGDTVGGMLGDSDGEIGLDAGRAWAQTGRVARNYQLTVDGELHNMVFIPEPTTICLLALGILGTIRNKK
ncbi:MAG: hypothetical protein BWY69_00392 [Planctomycetes bacterium ADurb.Bin401]|nr:MAG: hypothetical protein BWY69_00392 [Planctomycetes bacterium ADurb.Bin401]